VSFKKIYRVGAFRVSDVIKFSFHVGSGSP
jgi:hypothetical protein